MMRTYNHLYENAGCFSQGDEKMERENKELKQNKLRGQINEMELGSLASV